mmetsp:Transcript_103750/g.317707  ORF Transcript_103750/g.317707 Transcript_103750/m.317707 type:complete len:212 (-) Transcript_103750:185-820(-)
MKLMWSWTHFRRLLFRKSFLKWPDLSKALCATCDIASERKWFKMRVWISLSSRCSNNRFLMELILPRPSCTHLSSESSSPCVLSIKFSTAACASLRLVSFISISTSIKCDLHRTSRLSHKSKHNTCTACSNLPKTCWRRPPEICSITSFRSSRSHSANWCSTACCASPCLPRRLLASKQPFKWRTTLRTTSLPSKSSQPACRYFRGPCGMR